MTAIVNDYLSEKLKALSLGAVILVVFLHSHNEEIKFASGELVGEQSSFVLFAENFVSKGLARIAVPLFFAISGLLFYKSFEFTLHGVIAKFKGRFKSLFIPYLFWSVSGLILILILQSIPWSRNFFTRGLIIHYSISDVIAAILVNPIPYQLWFVRDLIMLTICSPIIWYLTKSTKGVWLSVLALLWVIAPKTFEFFSNEALFFYAVGCALVIDGGGLLDFKFSRVASDWLLPLWLLIVLLATYLLTFKQYIFILNVLNSLGIVTGLLCVWALYDRFHQEHTAGHSSIYGYTFFIFVFHEPLLTILKKGMFFLMGKTDFSSLLIYVSAPLIAIGISMLARYAFKRSAPRFYDFATGGR